MGSALNCAHGLETSRPPPAPPTSLFVGKQKLLSIIQQWMGNQNAGATVTSMTKCSPQKLIRQPMGFYTPTSRIIDCRSLWARRDENSTLSTRKMWRSVSQWVMIGPEKPIECGQPWTCSATCKNTFVEQRLYRSKNKLSISAHDKREKKQNRKGLSTVKICHFSHRNRSSFRLPHNRTRNLMTEHFFRQQHETRWAPTKRYTFDSVAVWWFW